MPIKLVMPSKYLIPCHPLLLLPSIFPSIRVFSNESAVCIRWPKCWSFSFSISPSKEYSGLISLRIDWFDLLAAQGTLNSLLQHHSLKASFLRCSAFFMVQLTSENDYWEDHSFDYTDLSMGVYFTLTTLQESPHTNPHLHNQKWRLREGDPLAASHRMSWQSKLILSFPVPR